MRRKIGNSVNAYTTQEPADWKRRNSCLEQKEANIRRIVMAVFVAVVTVAARQMCGWWETTGQLRSQAELVAQAISYTVDGSCAAGGGLRGLERETRPREGPHDTGVVMLVNGWLLAGHRPSINLKHPPIPSHPIPSPIPHCSSSPAQPYSTIHPSPLYTTSHSNPVSVLRPNFHSAVRCDDNGSRFCTAFACYLATLW
jgi:hypothetical protein